MTGGEAEPNRKDLLLWHKEDSQSGQVKCTSPHWRGRGTWSLSPMVKSMHVHPVFRVTHGLCAKYLLKKIEILKKKIKTSQVNSSPAVPRSCCQVEAPEGQFFKCSTVLA